MSKIDFDKHGIPVFNATKQAVTEVTEMRGINSLEELQYFTHLMRCNLAVTLAPAMFAYKLSFDQDNQQSHKEVISAIMNKVVESVVEQYKEGNAFETFDRHFEMAIAEKKNDEG